MKAIMLSIQPYYVFLIIARLMGWNIPQDKTVEVRKDFQRDKVWNKLVHIYCSNNRKSFNRIPKQYQPLMVKFLGKVIGDFVCDWIKEIDPHCDIPEQVNQYIHHYPVIIGDDCLTFQEMKAYLGNRTGYDWHISDLKIYDKPKELWEFKRDCGQYGTDHPLCDDCKYFIDGRTKNAIKALDTFNQILQGETDND